MTPSLNTNNIFHVVLINLLRNIMRESALLNLIKN